MIQQWDSMSTIHNNNIKQVIRILIDKISGDEEWNLIYNVTITDLKLIHVCDVSYIKWLKK